MSLSDCLYLSELSVRSRKHGTLKKERICHSVESDGQNVSVSANHGAFFPPLSLGF